MQLQGVNYYGNYDEYLAIINDSEIGAEDAFDSLYSDMGSIFLESGEFEACASCCLPPVSTLLRHSLTSILT